MSERGGGRFRGGKYKGRGRHSPYSRGGGGAGSGSYNRKVQRNNGSDGVDGGVGVKSEPDFHGAGAGPEKAPLPDASEKREDQSLVDTPRSGGRAARVRDGPSPRHALSDSPAQQQGDDEVVKEKKYSSKARMFIGNLPKDTSQDAVKEMFQRFGEVREVFVQREKNFGFIRMAYRSDAESAVASLDGKNFKGRELKVRFAASNSSVKVRNLHPMVSNELLEEAFLQFGEVENAIVVTDERGKSLGHGVVDFSRKGYAQNAVQRCSAGHFLLTKSPMPVLVEEFIRDNDEDGQPERYIPKNATYRSEREVPPRFAVPNSVEHAVASQWKMAYESEKRRREEVEQELRQARNNLVCEMENIREQHQTEMLRQELAHHQQEQLRLVQQLRMRQGNLGPPGSGMLEPNGAGGIASLFPPGQQLSASQQLSGERSLEEVAQSMMENPGFSGIGSGVGGALGGGSGVPGAGHAAPPGHASGSSFPPSSMAMIPPPLMGQHPLF